MSGPDSNRRQSLTAQSIPLRDLNRPPDDADENAPQRHRRTLSDRGRDLLRQTSSIATGQYKSSQYAPITELSPSPTRDGRRPQLDTSTAAEPSGIRVVHRDDTTPSPIDASAFQTAIGFGMNMDFEGDTSPPLATPVSEHSYDPYGLVPYLDTRPSEDHDYFPSTSYDDTTRLTDAHSLQPISGAAASSSPYQQDRSSLQSVQFLSPGDASAPARHGDDLGQVEASAGRLRDSRGRQRSLSPGQAASTLHRAGTMIRNMSQRVANVTNDSDVAERTIRRKSTLPRHNPQRTPSFPAVSEYDGPSSPTPLSPVEKPPSPVVRAHSPSVQWRKPPNPLRGKSLGVFSADNKLRMKLCNVLVHPATEPVLLLLIVVQTVLLAVDASNKAVYDPNGVKQIIEFDAIDYALLGLFVVYTIEMIIRIIVSGFIINPVEYSTINRQVGLREAITTKANQLFGGPQRQPSKRRNNADTDPTMGPQQPSILRTFTTAHAQINTDIHPAMGLDDSQQQQRVRLAHRAYLRHSFNRTDFVAVVSFWIAFVLNVANIENTHVVLVFEMLSCLRIIRLLNLTSGTSVWHKLDFDRLKHPLTFTPR